MSHDTIKTTPGFADDGTDPQAVAEIQRLFQVSESIAKYLDNFRRGAGEQTLHGGGAGYTETSLGSASGLDIVADRQKWFRNLTDSHGPNRGQLSSAMLDLAMQSRGGQTPLTVEEVQARCSGLSAEEALQVAVNAAMVELSSPGSEVLTHTPTERITSGSGQDVGSVALGRQFVLNHGRLMVLETAVTHGPARKQEDGLYDNGEILAGKVGSRVATQEEMDAYKAGYLNPNR